MVSKAFLALWTDRIAHSTVVLGLLLLSACDDPVPQAPLTLIDTEEQTPFTLVSPNQTWVYAPAAQTVMQRELLYSSEQRIGLRNSTAVPGDNQMLLRARYVVGQDIGRFRFEEFLQRTGGWPEPFQALESGDLLTGNDDLGIYFWAEQTYGEGTVCVLALRRLGSGFRQLPGNTSALDVMLRNCVNGTVEDALMPITAAYIGNYPGSETGAVPGSVRMLSPLAGPTP